MREVEILEARCLLTAALASAGTVSQIGGTLPEEDPNAAYVWELYRDLLGRFPDFPGDNAWGAQLEQGVQRSAVVQGFVNSLEYRARVVEGLYQSLLGRQAEPYGLSNWLNFLGANHTVEQMEAGLLASAEYSQLHAATSDHAFLVATYHDVLGRAVDPSGLAFWSASLTFGVARADVAFAILSSDERVQSLVRRSYEQYMYRPADPAGLAFFVSQVKQGLTDQSLIAVLDASDEFFSYFQPTPQPGTIT